MIEGFISVVNFISRNKDPLHWTEEETGKRLEESRLERACKVPRAQNI